VASRTTFFHSSSILRSFCRPNQFHASNDTVDCVGRDCRRLYHLSRQLRDRRMDAGALTLASSSVKFLLDEERERPTELACYILKPANGLVRFAHSQISLVMPSVYASVWPLRVSPNS
jgi:exoribonuclease R